MSELIPRAETTYGAEVEVAAFIPIPHHPIGARLRAHFERRVEKGVEDIAAAAGKTAEEVLNRLESGSDAYADLLEQTLREIERKASAEHRQAMARVAAQAWSGDDAAIDRAVLVVDTIADLQRVHVRVLVAAAKGNEEAGGWTLNLKRITTRPHPVSVEIIATKAFAELDTVRGIVGQLVARGLLWVDTVTTFNSERTDDHVLTELGADVLNSLSDSNFEGIG